MNCCPTMPVAPSMPTSICAICRFSKKNADEVFHLRRRCFARGTIVCLVLSTPEHNFPDAACPLSRAALDVLLRVKRELHEPLSIAFTFGAASGVSFLGAAARFRHHRSRRS